MVELFRSNFVFGLQGKLYQNFIDDIAKPIIEKIIATDDYEIIGFERHLSFKDFKNKENKIFDYIYTDFLDDIKKENNKVVYRKKVCITLDERLFDDTDICPNTGRKITAIKLAGVELAYFVYFDIKEFFDFVYDENINTKIEAKKQPLPLYQRLGYNNQDELDSILRSSKKLVVLLESLGVDVPIKQGKVDLIPAVSKDDKEFLELLNHQNPNVRDIVKAKLDMQLNRTQNNISNNYLTAKKIGYIHNHNDSYSYVRTSTNRSDTFNIPHRLFPQVQELPIGTVIKAECGIDEFGKIRKIKSYEQCSEKELDILFETFEGKLEREFGKDFAFIKSYDGIDIYVPPSWAKYFGVGEKYNVYCLAVQSLDNKGKLGWEALEVFEITSF